MDTSIRRPKRHLSATRLALLCSLLVAAAGCHLQSHGQNLEGVRLYEQGQYQAALHEFQKAVATSPNNADGYYNMAASLHRIGTLRNDPQMLQQAEMLYNQCLDLDSNHADCYRGLAVLLVETDRSDRAFALLDHWATISPGLAEPRVELARLHEEFGDRETAKLRLVEAVQLDQHNARALAALGRMRELEGDLEQALANYQRSYMANSMQPAIAERIASLNRTLSSRADSAISNVRTVNSTAIRR